MTLGHAYLLDQFGIKPTIAWQIDPFGHDSRIPLLFAEMQLDALVINRVHFHTKHKMQQSQALEFLWNVNENHSIFTHVLHTHYASPKGFDWEVDNATMVDDDNVHLFAQVYMELVKVSQFHDRDLFS